MKPIGPLMWEHRLIEKMLHEKYERLVESFTGEKAFKAGRAR